MCAPIVPTKPTVSETSLEQRQRIIALTTAGVSAPQIASALGCSVRTVHRWRARQRQAGPAGLAYHSRRPQTPHPRTTSPAIVARIQAIREAHPRWGARLIQRQLRLEGVTPVPCARTVQHWLTRLGYGTVRAAGKPLGWTPPAAQPNEVVWEVDFTKKRGAGT
jgi:transposase